MLRESDTPLVLGVDTGSGKFHAYRSDGETYSWVCKSKLDADTRRHELYTFAKTTFSILPPGSLVICEEPIAPAGKRANGKTTRLLSLAAGAVWAAHLEFNIFWYWVDLTQWKKVVIGSGGADKERVADWVLLNIGRGWTTLQDQDFYDAAAICRYGELEWQQPGG